MQNNNVMNRNKTKNYNPRILEIQKATLGNKSRYSQEDNINYKKDYTQMNIVSIEIFIQRKDQMRIPEGEVNIHTFIKKWTLSEILDFMDGIYYLIGQLKSGESQIIISFNRRARVNDNILKVSTKWSSIWTAHIGKQKFNDNMSSVLVRVENV